MIIASLHAYYERLAQEDKLPLQGLREQKISYTIVLSRQGELIDVHDIRDTSGKKPQPKLLAVPQTYERTSGTKPYFFWDKTSYVLGVTAKEDAKAQKRLLKEHEAFKTAMLALIGDVEDEGLVALRKFLQNWSPNNFSELPNADEEMLDSNVVFRLDGDKEYLHDRPAVKALCLAQVEKGDVATGMCLVTGEQKQLARLDWSIKGVEGAQSSGAYIVSFNKEAFISFGKEQSYNAPISARVADCYTKALNYLLRRENKRSLSIGDATTVFWAIADDSKKAGDAESFLGTVLNSEHSDDQEAKEVERVLNAVAQGRALKEIDPDLDPSTQVYVLGLSPNASRLSVRFWQTGDLEFFVKRIAQHYQDLHLEPLPWRTPPSVWRLLIESTPSRNGKHDSKLILPHLAGEMMRAIISGGNYPFSLLSNIVMRFRTDGDISGLRVALCKAVITRFNRNLSNKKEDIPVSLDTSVTNEGYLLGRWFAELEGAQRLAIKDANATIRGQYYGSASANPATTFPTLIRKYQNHISKVGKEKKGLAISIENKIGEIVDKLPAEFPKTLGMEDQGRFAIGYYHQRQEQFKKKDSTDT